jgi:hypothetical protein
MHGVESAHQSFSRSNVANELGVLLLVDEAAMIFVEQKKGRLFKSALHVATKTRVVLM